MGRKRIFTNKSKGDVLLGRRKRELSFDEAEPAPRDRKTSRRAARGDGPGLVVAGRIRKVHLVVAGVLAAVAGLLIWFFFFVYPSPISGVAPQPETFTNESNVDIRVTFSRSVKPSQVSLKVDGKDVTEQAKISEQSVNCKLGLGDGDHRAEVLLDGDGLMGKRTSQWSFSVDTQPPELIITRKETSAVDGSDKVKVSFAGKTDKDATISAAGRQLAVDEKGIFEGSVNSSRLESLKITATDPAGNNADTFIVTQEQTAAKGVHVSIFMASSNSELRNFIDLTGRTELNALEIDGKDERGLLGFDVDNRLAGEIGSATDYIQLDECVDQMRYSDVYSICRIVVFKDPILAEAKPGLAVQDKYGGLWGNGQWTDPYSAEVWDYNLSAAEAAARAGFNEIQFDYIRFPSDGDTSTCVFPGNDGRSPSDVIKDFLEYARGRLAKYNVFVSVDLFGLTAGQQGEMGIGQNVKMIAEHVDYISPMMYPSHYYSGEYGIKDPESNPADTVSGSMKEFKEVIGGTGAKLRPWLQDFTLRVPYTADMVRRQIDAVEGAGVKEWLLWDPECSYTESALQQK